MNFDHTSSIYEASLDKLGLLAMSEFIATTHVLRSW